MGEKRNACRVSARKPLKRNVYCRIILRHILCKQNGDCVDWIDLALNWGTYRKMRGVC